MNPFVKNGNIYDYNPGMLRRLREWLAGTGPYAGKPDDGAPDLSAYRRKNPLTLAQINRIAGQRWSSWADVDPPRKMVHRHRQETACGRRSLPSGTTPGIANGMPSASTSSHSIIPSSRSGLTTPAYRATVFFPRRRSLRRTRACVRSRFTSRGQVPTTIPPAYRLRARFRAQAIWGAIVYGPATENAHWLDNGHSLFATIARMDPAWAIVEMNAADLKAPMVQPYFARSYHAFRDMFNFDAPEVSAMAWNGSNGLYAGQPGYLPYTAWRNTPAEAAMRDFLVTHADLPLGARLWAFGAPGYLDDDGWRLEQGKVYARGGYLDLDKIDAATATLLSPPDQVIRAATIGDGHSGIAEPINACRHSGLCSDRSRSTMDFASKLNCHRTIRLHACGRADTAGVAVGLAAKWNDSRGIENRDGV